MDILSNKHLTNVFKPVPVSAVIHNVQTGLNKMIGFFSLSDEDKMTAGIDVDGEGRGMGPESNEDYLE
jgi:hypothetical protein